MQSEIPLVGARVEILKPVGRQRYGIVESVSDFQDLKRTLRQEEFEAFLAHGASRYGEGWEGRFFVAVVGTGESRRSVRLGEVRVLDGRVRPEGYRS